MTSAKDLILSLLTRHVVLIGLTIRLVAAWFLPLLLDSGDYIPGVAYTDIDYMVFTDAAQHVAVGESPYLRHTYRYTPFLAVILAKMNALFGINGGRYLFCLADTFCGWLVIKLRQKTRRNKSSQRDNSNDSLWWMYNPLAINICTRGSAESLVVLLPVLLTVWIVTNSDDGRNLLFPAFLAGLMHGIAVHSKLYPIIYSLSFMAYFATRSEQQAKGADEQEDTSFPWTQPRRLLRLAWTWIQRLLRPAPISFLVSFIATTTSLTHLAVQWYGYEALQEGMLYHLSRVDHRHNYSMFWYYIYLARGIMEGEAGATATAMLDMRVLSRVLLLPQALLLAYTSLGVAPHDLQLALFVQTFLFVTLNKVITAQYFTWYLCLLPLCDIDWSYRKLHVALAFLLISIVTWLASAYCLEMQGMAVHRHVWLASVMYFVANVNLLGALLESYKSRQQLKQKQRTTKRE